MIKVIIKKDEDKINQLTISGHALFSQHGSDIVCSAVSSIAVGGINAIHEMGMIEACGYQVESGKVDLKIKDCSLERLQVILETLCIQLKTIEESYSNYISIQEV